MSRRISADVLSNSISISGLVDFGEDEYKAKSITEKAHHGLVIMYQPLYNIHSAQPTAVFASKGPVNGETLTKLIVKAIVLLGGIGVTIHGVVSDGASTNRNFWMQFGVSGCIGAVKTYFPRPTNEDTKVFIFSDTPHLLKTIRNRLLTNDYRVCK